MPVNPNAGNDTADPYSGQDNMPFAANEYAATQTPSAAQQATDDNINEQFYNYLSSQGVSPEQFQALKTSTNPADIAQYNKLATAGNNAALNVVNAEVGGPSLFNQVIGGLALAGSVGALTAGAGAALAPAIGATGSVLGGTAGTIANGAVAGGVGGVAQGALTGGNVGKDALVGAVGGGLLGGINSSGLTTNAEGALTNMGMDNTAADAIVRGTEGAGVGALKGAITGNGAGNGALMGGATGAISGGVSGGIQDATGSAPTGIGAQVVNAGSGILASNLLSKYTAPSASQVVAPTTKATPAAAMSTTLPVQTQPTPATTAPTNIGPYSGFNSTGLGYQPRSQVDPGITNYATYGQGPEASFFAPTPGTT